ncbi:MAG: zinc protease [Myxococcota bacterium]|jgi:zinc protease
MACGPKYDAGPVPAEVAKAPVRLVSQLDPSAPNITLQAMIDAGSARDRPGQEGLASLTARALVEAGAGDRSSDAVRDALYPLGTGFELRVDRDWVTLRLTCHRDHAALCVELFADALTAPRFEEDAVLRLRDEAIYAVTDGLLGDEEALGEAALHAVLFDGHPYAHPPTGRAGTLEVLGPDQLRAFHQATYARSTVVAGAGGALSAEGLADLSARLEALPSRLVGKNVMFQPTPADSRTLTVVRTSTPVTGFHLAHPLDIGRDHPDWPALHLALTALGAHRQSFGRLFRTLRTDRGLNYGTYAYVEAYRERRGSSRPDPGGLRLHRHFSLWLRPTSLDNGAFALKLAIDELEALVETGLTQDELDEVRQHLVNSAPTLATRPTMRLAYALEAAATGTPDLLDTLPDAVGDLDLPTVNDVIARHLDPSRLRIVAVSGDADALVSALQGDAPTPIVYADLEPGAEQVARDVEIAAKALEIAEAWTVDGDGLFR